MGDGNYAPRLFNRDGTRNVYCKQCRRLVGNTIGSFGSVTCAICDAANSGTDLAPDIQDALTGTVRLDSGFMAPSFVVNPSPSKESDPLEGAAPRQGFVSYWLRVLTVNVFKAIKGVTPGTEDIPMSKKVAKERKRSRVFAIEDLEPKVVDKSIEEK